MRTNYHTHTTWCDGRDAPEVVVQAALAKGFDELGFSSHVDMLKDFDAYVANMTALKAKYGGRLRILCGLESEFDQGLERRARLDYVIGSFHFLTAPDGVRFAFDHTPQILADGIRDHFGGDAVAFVKAYFARERELVARGGFDFLAHPDLVRKFNAKHPFFDESADWYCGELEATADAIAAADLPVEMNTGAISRGWLDDAYPSPFFRSLLRARGVRFYLNSDAHQAATIDCAFDRFGSSESFVTLPRQQGEDALPTTVGGRCAEPNGTVARPSPVWPLGTVARQQGEDALPTTVGGRCAEPDGIVARPSSVWPLGIVARPSSVWQGVENEKH